MSHTFCSAADTVKIWQSGPPAGATNDIQNTCTLEHHRGAIKSCLFNHNSNYIHTVNTVLHTTEKHTALHSMDQCSRSRIESENTIVVNHHCNRIW